MLEYRGYAGLVSFDDEAELLHGEVFGTRDVVTFHTEKEARAKQQRADAAEAWTLAREIEMGFRRADGTRI